MRTLRLSVLVGLFSLWLVSHAYANANPQSVGLGVSLGASFPQGDSNALDFDDWDGSFNWGFYVNIPLAWTFHISPSAELYKFNNINATDVSLAFKFMIPMDVLDIYLGVSPGLTTAGNDTLAHVGALGGVSFNLVSNLGFFFETKYKILFEGDYNLRVLHLNVGVLFHF